MKIMKVIAQFWPAHPQNSLKVTTVIDRFLQTKRIKNLSPRTLIEYERALKQWAQAMPESLAAITVEELITYFDQREVAAKTKHNELRLVRSLFAFAEQQGYGTSNPATELELPVVTSPLPEIVCDEDIDALIELAATPLFNRKQDIWYSYRNTAVVLFLFSTGVRVSELCNLRRADIQINYQKNQYRALIRRGKGPGGGKDGWVLFNLRTAQALEEHWIRQVQGIYCFENHEGRPCRPNAIRTLFARLSRRLGKHIHPHMCRHTCATMMYDNGAETPDVMAQLRHSDIRITMRYIHVSLVGREKRYRKHHPLN